jgi:hypothetical protein
MPGAEVESVFIGACESAVGIVEAVVKLVSAIADIAIVEAAAKLDLKDIGLVAIGITVVIEPVAADGVFKSVIAVVVSITVMIYSRIANFCAKKSPYESHWEDLPKKSRYTGKCSKLGNITR